MAYKEGNRWTAQYYKSVQGKRKQIKKRGFLTKRDALDYERQQKLKKSGVIDMRLETFVEKYFEDKKNELKERTKKNKRYMMDQHIIPFFGQMKMTEITPVHIIEWQNEMYQKKFSDSYLRMIQNQLTALFTHATRIYDLENNPCKKTKRMGKSDSRSLLFWTLDEYNDFISKLSKDDRYYYIFEVLFYTGCRIGELLALTKKDIDLQHRTINIDKTYYRAEGKDIVTEPKTEQSVRKIIIPFFLAEELKEYMEKIYDLKDNDRIFPIVQEAVQHKMKRVVHKYNLKDIRVHDLRHSHVAYLIDKGVEPLLIKERLGHKDIRITLNTYGHLYPNRQRSVADMLNEEREESMEPYMVSFCKLKELQFSRLLEVDLPVPQA